MSGAKRVLSITAWELNAGSPLELEVVAASDKGGICILRVRLSAQVAFIPQEGASLLEPQILPKGTAGEIIFRPKNLQSASLRLAEGDDHPLELLEGPSPTLESLAGIE